MVLEAVGAGAPLEGDRGQPAAAGGAGRELLPRPAAAVRLGLAPVGPLPQRTNAPQQATARG